MKKRLLAYVMATALTVGSFSYTYAEESADNSTNEPVTEATTKETTTKEETTTQKETTTKEETTAKEETTTQKETTTKEPVTEATTKEIQTTTKNETTTKKEGSAEPTTTVKEQSTATTTKKQSGKITKTIDVEVEIDDTLSLSSKIDVPANHLDWRSSDEDIVTVTSSGKIEGQKKGSATVYAEGISGDAEYKYTFDVKVVRSSDDDDDDDDDDDEYDKTFTIKVDEKKDLYKYVDDKYDADEYSWGTSNKSIITVDEEGVVKGVKTGTASIKAKKGNKSYYFKVTVKSKSNSDDDKSASTKTSWNLYMDVDSDIDLSKFMDEDPRDCKWDIDEDYVEVNERTGKLETLKTGRTTVEAEGDDTYKFKIEIKESNSTRSLSIKKGETKSFEKLLPKDISEYTFTEDRKDVAKISGKGNVEGVANGTATIVCEHKKGDIVQIVVTVSGSVTTTTTTKEATTETTTRATTTQTTTTKVSFDDIATRPWALSAINSMASKGFVVGVGKGKFNPDGQCKRADFTIVLVKMFDFDIQINGTYSDVLSNKYYFPYVSTAKNNGLEAGVVNGAFRPEESITREEMMVMIHKALVKKGVELNIDQRCLNNFADSDQISAENRDAIAALINLKAVAGDSATTISPKKNITRAQMAVLLDNVYNVLKSKGII